MAIVDASVIRRVGIWAIVQSLPDEAALKSYLRAAYLGMAGVIVGSVLLGSALAAAMIALYRLLMEWGWKESYGLLATSSATLLVILGCFYLAGQWFRQLAAIKQETTGFTGAGQGMMTSALRNITDGFLEGLITKGERSNG